MKITVDAMIPSSRLVPTSLNKGRPVVLDEPNSDVSTAVRQLATRFTGQFEDVERCRESRERQRLEGRKKKRKLFSRT